MFLQNVQPRWRNLFDYTGFHHRLKLCFPSFHDGRWSLQDPTKRVARAVLSIGRLFSAEAQAKRWNRETAKRCSLRQSLMPGILISSRPSTSPFGHCRTWLPNSGSHKTSRIVQRMHLVQKQLLNFFISCLNLLNVSIVDIDPKTIFEASPPNESGQALLARSLAQRVVQLLREGAGDFQVPPHSWMVLNGKSH